jgi:hypothetical protein
LSNAKSVHAVLHMARTSVPTTDTRDFPHSTHYIPSDGHRHSDWHCIDRQAFVVAGAPAVVVVTMGDDSLSASELKMRYHRNGSIPDDELTSAQLRARHGVPANTQGR